MKLTCHPSGTQKFRWCHNFFLNLWAPGVVHSSSVSGLSLGHNRVIATEHRYLKQRNRAQKIFSLKFCVLNSLYIYWCHS